MTRLTLRLPDPLHEKLRWLAYRERRSQHAVLLEALTTRLKDVKVPKEDEAS
ncbi:ribbon-helix-helix protein, CopG family [bacterium]|nr:ribbon-helix-helix protein, CopG family [bacterium]